MVGSNVNNSLNMKYAYSFGQYFVKYIEAFRAGGIDVDAITIQNEPLNSNPGYPTMIINASQSTELIQNHVGPALKKAHIDTQIWAYDHNTGKPYPRAPRSATNQLYQTKRWKLTAR